MSDFSKKMIPRFGLRRLFLWTAIAATWIQTLRHWLDVPPGMIHVQSICVVLLLLAGQHVERRLQVPEVHRVEWTLLWVGIGLGLPAVAYEMLFR